MTDLDDLPLFDPPDAPRPGAAPARTCKHPRHLRGLVGEVPVCTRCGHQFDPQRQRRGRSARYRGTSDELAVARLLGGIKVGHHGGPHDVELPGYMRLQSKKLADWPSLAQVVTWLETLQPHGDIRGVTLARVPGPGLKAQRLLVVDLYEFARWHANLAADPDR